MEIKLLKKLTRPNCCAGELNEIKDVPCNYGADLVARGFAVALEKPKAKPAMITEPIPKPKAQAKPKVEKPEVVKPKAKKKRAKK